eukprot:366179-Chlamydomonas_euryale.AAC.3
MHADSMRLGFKSKCTHHHILLDALCIILCFVRKLVEKVCAKVALVWQFDTNHLHGAPDQWVVQRVEADVGVDNPVGKRQQKLRLLLLSQPVAPDVPNWQSAQIVAGFAHGGIVI